MLSRVCRPVTGGLSRTSGWPLAKSPSQPFALQNLKKGLGCPHCLLMLPSLKNIHLPTHLPLKKEECRKVDQFAALHRSIRSLSSITAAACCSDTDISKSASSMRLPSCGVRKIKTHNSNCLVSLHMTCHF